ncbi:MAG: PEP-CTERM sorting domain-containing protein, partial [Janthinobacterium lividum]
LVTLSNGNGSYTITSITGTGVTGLINPDGFGTNDNLLFPDSASGLVDQNGFSFTDVMGDTGYDVNLVSDGLADGNYLINLTDTDGDTQQIPAGSFMIDPVTADATGNVREFSFSFASAADAAAVTPEPSSIALLGTGLLGVAGLLKRRGE